MRIDAIDTTRSKADATADNTNGEKTLRTIALEEHCASPGFVNGPGRQFMATLRDRGGYFAEVYRKLQDIGAGRVAEMDAAGIDMEVLSLSAPGVEQSDVDEQISVAREVNDFLADGVAKYPTRLGAFATLPVAAPDKASEELDLRVTKQGFKGAVINGHTRGRYLDDEFFSPILERAEALGVPIYLHPTIPPKPVVDAYYSGFSPGVSSIFSIAGWGWHVETSVHVIRMILGGVFDRFPKLQVIIGHMGEGIPFLLPRMNATMPQQLTKLERPIEAYLRQNIHYTFSGFTFPATFLNLLLEVGVDRIMFSCDDPYQSMKEAREFLQHIPVSDVDRDRIAFGNAEKLLRL